MGTNLEGRLIALEIERKRLSERLEKALDDISALKQYRRTAAGPTWTAGGGGGAIGLWAHVDALVPAADPSGGGYATFVSAILSFDYAGGSPVSVVRAASARVVNASPAPLAPDSWCPVLATGDGHYVVTGVGAATVGVFSIVSGLPGGSPPSYATYFEGVTVYVAGGFTLAGDAALTPVAGQVVICPFPGTVLAGKWYGCVPIGYSDPRAATTWAMTSPAGA